MQLSFEELMAMIKDPRPLIIRKAEKDGVIFIRVHHGEVIEPESDLCGFKPNATAYKCGDVLVDTHIESEQLKKTFDGFEKIARAKERMGRLMPSWLKGE